MNSKKFNVFAIFMVVVMCAFSVFIGINNRGKNGIDGTDGKSSYELALEQGLIPEGTTEVEYLRSLYGKDGSSITLEDIYNAYLAEKRNVDPNYDCSMLDFLQSNFADSIKVDTSTLIKYTTQTALRSTVDICYHFYDGRGVYTKTMLGSYKQSTTPAYGVSAGSGVIYKIDDTAGVAYIITNYHVVYASNYTSDTQYNVFYDGSDYFTAKIENNSINRSAVPVETHFLPEYDVYLYGYQDIAYRLSATFVGGSADNDIAVLKIDKNSSNTNNALMFSSNYEAAEIGDSTKLSSGEGVVAVGNPLLADTSSIDTSNVSSNEELIDEVYEAYVDAICLTSTSGDVSNVSEYCNFTSLLDSTASVKLRLIRVSCAINAGNSGGSLFDLNGKLIGIVNGKIESASYDNVGYAIPVNVATAIADQVIAQCEGRTETRVKILSSTGIGLTVDDGNRSASFDSGTTTWETKANVVVKTVTSASKLNGKVSAGDIINSVVVDGMTYNLNFAYELNDVLLKVISGKTSSYSVTFKITTTEAGSLVDKDIVINFEDGDFAQIA